VTALSRIFAALTAFALMSEPLTAPRAMWRDLTSFAPS
jgi:hypothetical protein